MYTMESTYKNTGLMSALQFFICCAFLTGIVSSEADFGYETDDKQIGPDHWADHYQTCAGKYQSPIDISEIAVVRKAFPKLQLEGFYDLPLQTKITNNGHTVVLELNQTQEVLIMGGPLDGNYTFAQLHFHWGQNDSVGSEDKINNRTYSMELHMVFYKTKYGSVKHAMEHKDGLTVFAVFYEAGDLDNDVYSEITETLPKIETPNSSHSLQRGFTLRNFLPHNIDRYFTYYGSLTTPPCSEVVTWIDFKHSTRLSHRQLNAFRNIRTQGGLLTHNYRPVQPLSDRDVFYNINFSSGHRPLTSSLLISATLATAIYFYCC